MSDVITYAADNVLRRIQADTYTVQWPDHIDLHVDSGRCENSAARTGEVDTADCR